MLSYTNCKGVTYYVHRQSSDANRCRYTARRTSDGALEALPEGYEIVENVHGQVSVRRRRPRKLTAEEQRSVREALDAHGLDRYRFEVKDKTIFLCEPSMEEAFPEEFAQRSLGMIFDLPGGIGQQLEASMREELGDEAFEKLMQEHVERTREKIAATCDYQAVLKLTLRDERERRFTIARMVFRGEGGWYELDAGPLAELLNTYVPHLGKDSFFELI